MDATTTRKNQMYLDKLLAARSCFFTFHPSSSGKKSVMELDWCGCLCDARSGQKESQQGKNRHLELPVLPLLDRFLHPTGYSHRKGDEYVRHQSSIDLGMDFESTAGCIGCGRRISVLQVCRMQERCLSDHGESLAQHDLRSDSWGDVHGAVRMANLSGLVRRNTDFRNTTATPRCSLPA